MEKDWTCRSSRSFPRRRDHAEPHLPGERGAFHRIRRPCGADLRRAAVSDGGDPWCDGGEIPAAGNGGSSAASGSRKTASPGRVVPRLRPDCETASRTAELPPSLSLDGAVWVSAQARGRPRGNAPDRRGHAPDSCVCGRGYGMSRRTTTSANLWRGGVEGRPIPAGRRALRGWVTNY